MSANTSRNKVTGASPKNSSRRVDAFTSRSKEKGDPHRYESKDGRGRSRCSNTDCHQQRNNNEENVGKTHSNREGDGIFTSCSKGDLHWYVSKDKGRGPACTDADCHQQRNNNTVGDKGKTSRSRGGDDVFVKYSVGEDDLHRYENEKADFGYTKVDHHQRKNKKGGADRGLASRSGGAISEIGVLPSCNDAPASKEARGKSRVEPSQVGSRRQRKNKQGVADRGPVSRSEGAISEDGVPPSCNNTPANRETGVKSRAEPSRVENRRPRARAVKPKEGGLREASTEKLREASSEGERWRSRR